MSETSAALAPGHVQSNSFDDAEGQQPNTFGARAVPSYLTAVAPAAPAAPAAAAVPAASATQAVGRIAAGTTSVGDIVTHGGANSRLVVEGRVVGDIYHSGVVEIEQGGIVHGSITASELIVRGRVERPRGECVVTNFVVEGEGSVHVKCVKTGMGCLSYSSSGDLNTQISMLPAGEAQDLVATAIQGRNELLDEEVSRLLESGATV